MAKTKMEIKCEKCGKPQQKNAKKSNNSWSAFDCNQKCKCGGKFVMFIDGKRLG